MKQSIYSLVDFKTGKTVKPTNFVFGGDTPWDVVMDIDFIRSRINSEYFKKSPAFESKYLPLMPIANHAEFVSLSEGATPLMKSKNLGKKLGVALYFKYEGQNPTGSFKDRGSAMDISMAKELGAKAVAVASTGNMAASAACYAAAAGIPCFVFVPEGAPPSKLAQVISYGGKIVQVKGNFNDAVNLAKKAAEELSFYLAGDYAFRVEGQKSAAFEIVDQLFFRIPDAVIIPMGCGTNLASYGKGFRQYKELGFIDTVPQLIGVQAENVCPIVTGYDQKKKEHVPFKKVDTIASAIAIGDPMDGPKALRAIAETKGKAVAVSETEMLEAQYNLAKEEGLFVEPSSAATYAALLKMAQNGSVAGKTFVCVLTGNGLKDTAPILKIATKPPTINVDIDAFLALYNNDYFQGKSVIFYEKDSVAFDSKPSEETVQKMAQQVFGTKLADAHLQSVKRKVDEFLKKGKKVTYADFQDIMQDVLETVPSKQTEKIFKVLDFTVTTGKDRIPDAQVVVMVNGKEIKADAIGVGPIDAIINALKKATNDTMDFALTDFNIVARSRGTDAAAYTELTLQRNGSKSVGQGTSPDTLQASIEAFENAYNGLYSQEGENHE